MSVPRGSGGEYEIRRISRINYVRPWGYRGEYEIIR